MSKLCLNWFLIHIRNSQSDISEIWNEPTNEMLALFVLRKFIPQICMRSHPAGLGVWFLVWPFVYFHSSCVQTAKALARLRGCAGSPEPSLVAYAVSTITSWAGSNKKTTALFQFHGKLVSLKEREHFAICCYINKGCWQLTVWILKLCQFDVLYVSTDW